MASALICPACQARNKPNWEFCARCGESLEGAAPQAEGPGRRTKAPPRTEEAGPPGDLSSFYLLLMVALMAVVVAAACQNIKNSPPPPPPTPGPFTFGGPVPASPPAATAVAKAGASEGEEGRRLLAQGRAAEALPLLQQAVADDPGNASFKQLLGQALWDTGDREGALRRYAEAASLEPAQYRLGYAQALDLAGQAEAAAAELEGLLAAQPDSLAALEGLAHNYYRRGDYAKALPLLEKAAPQARDAVVMQELAYAAEKAGDPARAADAYRRVLAQEPLADVTRGLLAENLFVQGKADDAVAVLREGLKLSPQTPLLHRGLGSVLERSGRSAEAAAAYREYARLAPNAPDAAEIAARAARLEGSGS
jgi:Flp pilus assembly protein TadD